jgi:transposase
VLPRPCLPTFPLTGLRWPWTVTCRGRRRDPQGAASNYKNLANGTAAPSDLELQKAKPADREALGHSRGGLSTKVHLIADQRCRPLAFVTTVGQRHDAVAFELVLGKVSVARSGLGRPRTRPDYALADKAYSSRAIREHLAKRGIKAVIPIKDDQADARIRKGSRGGRPPAFDTVRYRQRNTVERAVNKLRGTRAVATRYDKRDYMYRGTLTVAAIRIWLRDPVSDQLQDTP